MSGINESVTSISNWTSAEFSKQFGSFGRSIRAVNREYFRPQPGNNR